MKYSTRNAGVRYCGGKGKVAAGIVPIINSLTTARPGTVYWEPFVGSGKVMAGVRAGWRVGTDADPHVLDLIRAVREGWDPPKAVSEAEYKHWQRVAKDGVRDPMVAFVLYGCSFGARFGQGYARSKKGYVNFAASARTALLRQKPYLQDVWFGVQDYRASLPKLFGTNNDLDALRLAKVVYCDPPYENTKPAGSTTARFDSAEFWRWATAMKGGGWTVLVSEYACPIADAVVLWEKDVASGIRFGTGGDGGDKGDGRRKREKLFCLSAAAARSVGLGLI